MFGIAGDEQRDTGGKVVRFAVGQNLSRLDDFAVHDEFDDPHATTLYMDLRNGRLLQRLDTHRRVKRWLFAFFHSWDWLPLLHKRPLWDVLLVAGSLGGLVISLTGMVIGWRRLVR